MENKGGERLGGQEGEEKGKRETAVKKERKRRNEKSTECRENDLKQREL